jgi:hypothetical protein
LNLATARLPSGFTIVNSYERFADMIDRHWDGIAAYCRPENKVSLGFVEGLNNKIRVFQRRAYGLRDEEYLPASRSSPACFPRYDRVVVPTRIPEEPQFIVQLERSAVANATT